MFINLCSKYSWAMSNPQKIPTKCHREGPAYSAGKAASRPQNKHSEGKIPAEKASLQTVIFSSADSYELPRSPTKNMFVHILPTTSLKVVCSISHLPSSALTLDFIARRLASTLSTLTSLLLPCWPLLCTCLSLTLLVPF